MPLKIFIHGLESNNQGTKAAYFRLHFPGMLTPNFEGSLRTRMGKLNQILAGETCITLVGSSFGGLMAAIFALQNPERVGKMILLAPALNLWPLTNYPFKKITVPTVIYHGDRDQVIPLHASEQVSREIFICCTFNRVHDDHFLHETFKAIQWHALLNSDR